MENALGAPTQGLGQTVTFTTNLPGVPTLQLPSGGGARGGITGGQDGRNSTNTFSVAAPVQVDPTMAVLMKAGEKALAGKVEEIRQQKFVEGMHRAASGTTILEIASEQPWYSQIFGDGDLIGGARAYNSQTKAQETVAALSEQMPELRKMDGAAFQNTLQGALKNAMTGDAATDANIMQAFARTAPSLSSAWTRERYKYVQEEALNAFNGTVHSAGKVAQLELREMAGNDVDPDLRAAAEAKYIGSLSRPAGMNPEVHFTAVASSLISQAEAGNFYAIQAAKKGGVIDLLPPALQARVLRTAETNQRQHPSHPSNEKYQMELDNLMILAREDLPPGATDEQIAAREAKLLAGHAKINADYQKETGNEFPFLSLRQQSGEKLHFQTAVRRAKREQAEEVLRAAKARAEAEGEQDAQDRRYKSLVAVAGRGEFDLLAAGEDKATAGEEDWLIRRLAGDTFNVPGDMAALRAINPVAAKDYETAVKAVAAGVGVETFRAKMASQYMAAADTIGPQFNALYDNYLRVKEVNPEALGRVFTDTQLKRLGAFELLYPRSTSTPAQSPEDNLARAHAHVTAFKNNPMMAERKLDKEGAATALKEMYKQTSHWIPEVAGGQLDTSKDRADKLFKELEPHIALLANFQDTKTATAAALGSYKRNGGVILGDYFWQDKSIAGRPLDEVFRAGDPTLIVPSNPEVLERGMRDFVQSVIDRTNLEERGASAAATHVRAMGNGRLALVIPTEDVPVYQTFSYKDVGRFISDKHKLAAKTSLTLGVPTTEADYKKGVQIARDELNRRKAEGK